MEFGFAKNVLKKKSKMIIPFEKVGINRNTKIIEFAAKKLVYSYEDESIFEVWEKIVKRGFRRIPIVDKKERLVGIITYTDLLDAFLRNEDLKQEIALIMVREVITCDVNDTVEFVLQKMKLSRKGGLPVIKKEKIFGIVTERDILNRFVFDKFGIEIKKIMTPNPFYISQSLSIQDVARTMVSTKYRRFPIVENGKVIGIITGMDIFNYIFENGFNIETLDEDMKKIMKKDVFKVGEEDDLSVAINLMREKNVGGLVVVDDENNLKGIITERDIINNVI